MDKENLIELTNKLYKLTLLFPKKEPLRYKMREVADEILANSVSNPSKIKKNLEIIKSYFKVARWQNWVSYFDILEIEEEYDKIECDLKIEFLPQPNKVDGERVSDTKTLEGRKEKILEILKEKEKIQVGELKELLPDVSKRTLRRDFDQLLKQGLVERIGERNETFYCLKTV